MKPCLVLCVLLSVVLSARSASVSPSVTPFTAEVPEQSQTTHGADITYNSSFTFSNYVTSTHLVTSYPSPETSVKSADTSRMAPTSQSLLMCHDGWEVFQGRCYFFVSETMTWPQAQSNCAVLESMLVSVHSIQEYSFLQQLTNTNGNQQAWLGGFYLQNEWLWLDGSWFHNNTWNNDFPEITNPCLWLNSNEAWSNLPCDTTALTASICVKNSNVPSAVLCPAGWTAFQGRCYFFNTATLTWPEADANCAALEASLASVHSPQEYFFLYQQTANNNYDPAWLGGFYLDDQWLWLDGSWFYQGFFTQMSPVSTSECLCLYSSDGWSNNDCNLQFSSFCVKDGLSNLK